MLITKLNYFSFLLLSCIFCILPNYVLSIEIATSYGHIRGETTSLNRKTFHIFKKVPYAQAPLGNLRFARPEPARKWKHILDATKYGPACMSNRTSTLKKPKSISEDCLHINIFTSSKCLITKCPVMFFLHGGTINFGSAVEYNDTFILERYASKDVVFVLSAYRLGSFGLLALSDQNVVPRNLPVYDVIEALKFTKNIISSFGGIPTDITVMGHSSGGTLAMQLSLSKLVDPEAQLFQKIISLSGILSWMPESRIRETTRRFIILAECDLRSDKEIVNCLRQKDPQHLLAIQSNLEIKEGYSFEGTVFNEPFVSPEDTKEGYYENPPKRHFLGGTMAMEYGIFKEDETFVYDVLDFEHKDYVTEQFNEDGHKAMMDRRPFMNFESQTFFLTNFLTAASLKKQGSDVYLYEYRQYPLLAYHSTDLPFIIGSHRRQFTSDEEYIDRIYSEHFVNFSKYNNPSPHWDQFDIQQSNFYSIEVNQKKSIFPQNKAPYHLDIVSYWINNLTEYNDNFEQKIQINVMAKNIVEEKAPASGIASGAYIMFGLIVLVGVTVIVMVCIRRSRKPSGYMSLS